MSAAPITPPTENLVVQAIRPRESVGVGTFFPADYQHNVYMDLAAGYLRPGGDAVPYWQAEYFFKQKGSRAKSGVKEFLIDCFHWYIERSMSGHALWGSRYHTDAEYWEKVVEPSLAERGSGIAAWTLFLEDQGIVR